MAAGRMKTSAIPRSLRPGDRPLPCVSVLTDEPVVGTATSTAPALTEAPSPNARLLAPRSAAQPQTSLSVPLGVGRVPNWHSRRCTGVPGWEVTGVERHLQDQPSAEVSRTVARAVGD